MIRFRLEVIFVTVIAVSLLLGLVECRERYPFLVRDRPARWGEYGTILQRRTGPLKYLGGAHINYGGCDVYDAGGDLWWIVGPGRRFTSCRPAEAAQVLECLIREECERRGPPEGWEGPAPPAGAKQ